MDIDVTRRDRLLQQIEKLAACDGICPHLLIRGPPGSGKTTLVMHLLQLLYGKNLVESAEPAEEDFGISKGVGARTRMVISPVHVEFVCRNNWTRKQQTGLVHWIQDDARTEERLNIAECGQVRPSLLWHGNRTAAGVHYTHVVKAIVFWHAEELTHFIQEQLRRLMELHSASQQERNIQDTLNECMGDRNAKIAHLQIMHNVTHLGRRIFILVSTTGGLMQPLLSRTIVLRVPAFEDDEMRTLIQQHYPKLTDPPILQHVVSVAAGNANIAMTLASIYSSVAIEDSTRIFALDMPWKQCVRQLANYLLYSRPIHADVMQIIADTIHSALLPNMIPSSQIILVMVEYFLQHVDLRCAWIHHVLTCAAATDHRISKRQRYSNPHYDIHIMMFVENVASIPLDIPFTEKSFPSGQSTAPLPTNVLEIDCEPITYHAWQRKENIPLVSAETGQAIAQICAEQKEIVPRPFEPSKQIGNLHDYLRDCQREKQARMLKEKGTYECFLHPDEIDEDHPFYGKRWESTVRDTFIYYD